MCGEGGECLARPGDCEAMPGLSGPEGCYCPANHSLCRMDEMCDTRNLTAGCGPLPPVCPPMPQVVFDSAGCYCRWNMF